MKLFDFGIFVFILFVANCYQFEKARDICEKNNYESKGCKIHKSIDGNSKKKSDITFN